MRTIKAFWRFGFVAQGDAARVWPVPHILVPGWTPYHAALKQARRLMKRSVKRRGYQRYTIVNIQYMPVPWGVSDSVLGLDFDLRKYLIEISMKDVAAECQPPPPGMVFIDFTHRVANSAESG